MQLQYMMKGACSISNETFKITQPLLYLKSHGCWWNIWCNLAFVSELVLPTSTVPVEFYPFSIMKSVRVLRWSDIVRAMRRKWKHRFYSGALRQKSCWSAASRSKSTSWGRRTSQGGTAGIWNKTFGCGVTADPDPSFSNKFGSVSKDPAT